MLIGDGMFYLKFHGTRPNPNSSVGKKYYGIGKERTCNSPSPRNWFPDLKGTWMTTPNLVISFAVLCSRSATPLMISIKDDDIYEIWEVTYFKIGHRLLYDSFPCNKTFDDDIGWLQVLRSDIFLDENENNGAVCYAPSNRLWRHTLILICVMRHRSSSTTCSSSHSTSPLW